MASKLQEYRRMSEEAQRQLTGSLERWQSFLATASRLYKYPYHEQVMIHAQRPDATACAEFDVWNNTMRRYVRRGSKGIALIDTSGDRERLRYVFDVSDTDTRPNSRSLNLWELREEHIPAVSSMLEKNYGIPAGESFAVQLEAVGSQLAREYWEDNRRDILGILEDSFLEEYDEFNVGVAFRNAAEVSISYSLMLRCGLEPENYFEHEDFMGVFDFNTPETAGALGTAVSGINQQVLREIGATIRNYERELIAERSIVISYCPLQNKFEVGYQATKNDPEWIYNISDLFTSTNTFKFIGDFIKRLGDYRSTKGSELTDEEQGLIADRINGVVNLKSHTLPVFDIKSTAEEEDVSEIFVRVNSGGVSLKQNDFILTLLSLYWDDGRREIEQFSKDSTAPAKGKTTSYNQLTTVSAQDVIRVVMAYAFDRARLKYGYKLLRGADFDKKGAVDDNLRIQRFNTLKEKLPDVLDVHSWHEFIKAIMNAGYLSGDLILSGNAIFYTYALYLIAKHRFNASYNENIEAVGIERLATFGCQPA